MCYYVCDKTMRERKEKGRKRKEEGASGCWERRAGGLCKRTEKRGKGKRSLSGWRRRKEDEKKRKEMEIQSCVAERRE